MLNFTIKQNISKNKILKIIKDGVKVKEKEGIGE